MTAPLHVRAGVGLLLAGALFSFAACLSPRRALPPPGAPARIPAFPFLRQEGEEGCGASALAMVLRHLGLPVEPAELAAETRTEGLRGTLVTDLAVAARRRGFDAEVAPLSTERVASLVAEGVPPILLVDDGFLSVSVPHYVVAFGLDGKGLLVHSGSTEGRVIPWRELAGKRSKMGNLALVVRRKGDRP